jgi:hypothetical protein
MMHKQSIALHKPSVNIGAAGLQLSGIFSRLRNALRFQIPTGYQDESGFHMGVKPAQKEIQWPQVW